MLVGEVFLEDGKRLPSVGDKIIDEVNDMKVLEGSFLFQLPNGTPVSLVKLEDGRELLLQGDTLVERIGEKKIVRVVEGCNGFLPDGTLVGAALLEDNKVVFFRGDELLDSIHGEKITGVGYNLRPLPDGTVEGKLEYGGSGTPSSGMEMRFTCPSHYSQVPRSDSICPILLLTIFP